MDNKTQLQANNERINALTEILQNKTSGATTEPNPLIATSDAEMENLLVASNLGKVVKFTGVSETYETDTYYVIAEV